MQKIFSIFVSILFILIICTPFLAHAQTGPPPLDGDPGTPIDGGASLLVGAAVVYGAKKLRRARHHQNG